jgi:hypothetical protein
MKRLIATVLALSLLGTAAASAQPYGGYGGYDRGVQRDYGDRGYGGYRDNGWNRDRYQNYRWDDRRDYDRDDYRSYRRGNNDGALIGLGVGLFALGMIAASSQHHGNDGYRYGR